MVLLVEALFLEVGCTVIVTGSNRMRRVHPWSFGLRFKHRVFHFLCLMLFVDWMMFWTSFVMSLELLLCLLNTPIHIRYFVVISFTVGLRGESSFFAIEWSLFNVYLLQILDILLDSESSFSHIISLDVVKRYFLIVSDILQSISCWVKAILNASCEFLLTFVIDLVLARTRSQLSLPLSCFKPFRLRKVSYFWRASFLEWVILVSLILYLSNALFSNLFFMILLQSGSFLYLYFCFSKYLLPCFSDFFLYIIYIVWADLIIARTWDEFPLFYWMIFFCYYWTKCFLSVVKWFGSC